MNGSRCTTRCPSPTRVGRARCAPPPRPWRSAAFTLAEVLATMLLVAIVLPVALRGVSLSLSAASTAKHKAEAAQLAEAKLQELLLTGEWNLSTQSGDWGDEWPGYSFTSETQSRDFSTTEVAVTVKWIEEGQERSLRMSTLTRELGVASASSSSGTSGSGAAGSTSGGGR